MRQNDETDHVPIITPPFDVADQKYSCGSKEEEREYQQGCGNTWGDRDRACRSSHHMEPVACLSHDSPVHMMETTESRGRASSVTMPHRGHLGVRPISTSFFLAYGILGLVSLTLSTSMHRQSPFCCGLEHGKFGAN